MNDSTSREFGLVVAYLLPGFIGLAGLAPLFPTMAQWLRPVSQSQAGLGPTVYVLLAATAVGMIVSCIRWLIVDQIHGWLGVVPPLWDDRSLHENLAAFNYIVEAHYRYYQCYANLLVAIIWAYGVNRWMGTIPHLGVQSDLAVIVLCVVLFVGSRDALIKYYRRTGRLIGLIEADQSKGENMTNGNHQAQEAAAATQQTNKQTKPKVTVNPQQADAPASKPKK